MAAAAADADAAQCPVCMEGFGDGSVQWLACTHRIHSACADAMIRAQRLTCVEEIRCPVCRSGGVDVEPPSPTRSELERIVDWSQDAQREAPLLLSGTQQDTEIDVVDEDSQQGPDGFEQRSEESQQIPIEVGLIISHHLASARPLDNQDHM